MDRAQQKVDDWLKAPALFSKDSTFYFDDHAAEKHRVPGTSRQFEKFVNEMTPVAAGIAKKVLKKPADGAKKVDLCRNVVTYRRNCYEPLKPWRFETGARKVCLPSDYASYGLDAFMEAISTMSEGEHSVFLFRSETQLGAMRYLPCIVRPVTSKHSDTLCDIRILSVEEVAEQAAVDAILEDKSKTFAEIMKPIAVTELRAGYYLSQESIDNAVKLYELIVQAVQGVGTEGEKERGLKKWFLTRAMTNLAVCKNKQQDWQEALKYVELCEAMWSTLNQPKERLLEKGRALMELGKLETALKVLEDAKKQAYDEDGEEISEVIKECEKRKVYMESLSAVLANLELA